MRWDGYRFRRYAADAQTPGSLPDSFILELHIDERGRLWIGTSAGGLARYEAERDDFVVASGPSGVKGAAVLSITGDSKGGLWVGTEGGLNHLDAHHPQQLTPLASALADGLPDGAVQAVLNDRDGTLWVGTRHGLWRRSKGTTAFSAMPLGASEDSQPAINKLYQDTAGRIWVGTRAHGAFIIDEGSTREVRESSAISTLQTDSVLAITEATPGEVWLLTCTPPTILSCSAMSREPDWAMAELRASTAAGMRRSGSVRAAASPRSTFPRAGTPSNNEVLRPRPRARPPIEHSCPGSARLIRSATWGAKV